MTSPSDPAAGAAAPTEAAVAAREKIIRAAQGSLRRYRVMAYVTGVMLLVLVVEMAMKYVFEVDDDIMRYVTWIPYAHGWIYVVYLVTVVDLWSKMRWTVSRLVVMVLGGVVPVMSFVVEKRVHADAEARVAAARTV